MNNAIDVTISAEQLKNLSSSLENANPTKWLPNIPNLMANISLLCRIAILLGPVILLVLGLAYYFIAPKEANWYFGYRCYFGMGSPRAWQYTQKLAGMVLGGLGLVMTLVSVILSFRFASMDVQNVVWGAVTCLSVEVITSLIATVFINIWTMNCFDAKGRVRRKSV